MNTLVIVLSSQLLYYLLIAQTGVVGALDSQINELYTLPIGGVIGAFLSGIWHHRSVKFELCFMFAAQMVISWFYPHYSLWMILLLGFVVGYTTPLLLYVFRGQNRLHLALGLAISYAFGTALYTYPYAERDTIAVILPLISVAAIRFASISQAQSEMKERIGFGTVAVMMLWIFADSALFETLSRSGDMDIWSRYPELIIVSHTLGVYMAYRFGNDVMERIKTVWVLFALSYLFYWIKEPVILAIVYPVVISYYNVLLFKRLIETANIRLIAFSMIGIGWIAASAANGIAFSHHLWVAAAVLGLSALAYPFYYRRIL